MGKEDLLDVHGAARLLRLSSHSVKLYAFTGRLPCRRIGRHVVFERSVLLDWRRQHPGPRRPRNNRPAPAM